jgi:hypothetical protein
MLLHVGLVSWYRKQLADLILKVVDIWCDIDPEVSAVFADLLR